MQSNDKFWFTLATPISDWFEHGDYKADFILKDTNLVDDFKQIQDYFCSQSSPIHLPNKSPSYKKYYNKTTKAIVAEIFKKDIDRFGYKF